ncbi:hypothetical protein KY331_00255 [Candidatus Woesearchaeota archaeon]|nr:hypothetical protein [Candidatus Woesearchaeota archaeon]
MRKKTLIILLLISMLFLTSCKVRRPGEPEERQPEEIYKGTKGVDISFVKGLPPSKIYDTSTLTLIAELRNQGTADVTGKCFLHLSGFDDKIVQIMQKSKACGLLEGKSVLNPEGGFDTQEFTTDRIWMPEGTDSYKPKFVITACYDYETTANPLVCIDPNLYSIQPVEQACQVKDVMTAGGQGAPVGVTRVDVDMMKNKVLFKIHITNQGKGQVLRTGLSKTGYGPNSCPFNLDYDDLNIVDYDVSMRGASLIKCSPELAGSRVRLVDNKATVFCTFAISGEYAFTTPLNIRLNYAYMDSISKDVEILRTPQ